MITIFCPHCGGCESVVKGIGNDFYCDDCQEGFDIGDSETEEVNSDVIKAHTEGRFIILPVPIGGTIYIPFKYADNDGSVEEGVEEAKISGYMKEGTREFYTLFDENGASDIAPGEFYLTMQEAVKALETMEVTGGASNGK